MTNPSAFATSAYPGDAQLARLLAAARAGKSAADVRSIVAGVLAAPQGYDPDAWMAMVAADPDETLRAALRDLKDTMALGRNDGRHAGPPAPAWRLKALRRELARRGLDGFIVPRADEHQGESVPSRADRLRWLTGFSGSAGVAVVLIDKAAIFIDGRYTLQVESEVRTQDYERRHLTDDPPYAWVAAELGQRRLGYDPLLHTVPNVERYAASAAKAGGELVAVESNPVDAIWSNQPAAPLSPMRPQLLEHAGMAAQEKIDGVVADLKESGETAAVLSEPSSVAWLLNIRGGDIPDTPVSLGFAVIEASGAVTFFTDPRKLTADVRAWLPHSVTVQDRAAMASAIDALSAGGGRIRLDSDSTPVWFANRIENAGGKAVVGNDPCAMPKACKNATEIAGTRAAHIRDGAALTTFLAWLDHATRPGSNIEVDELSAADKLAECRSKVEGYRGGSFSTISGFGPNGAVVHYHASARTNRKFEAGSLYLVDSGGQYPDGTTDVTRTISIGEPDTDQKRYFTAVLRGHIALATVRFPEGTNGVALDALAHAPLWQIGANYDHGTGHGVGSHLGVHEGPQRISKAGTVPLRRGMIVSNEPGYYRTDAWGIRIENLVVVEEDDRESERPMLRLSTITKAPIDRRLIAVEDMTASEIAWLDAYHADVRETLLPLVDADTAAWLKDATRPLAEG
jgi:Xaa-Pro aminopeptidase